MSSSWCIDESSKSGKVYSKNLLQLSGNKNVSMNYVWVRTGGGSEKNILGSACRVLPCTGATQFERILTMTNSCLLIEPW